MPSEPGLSRVPPFHEEGGRLRSVTAFARKAAQPRWSPRSLRVPQACGPRASLRRGGRGSFTPPAVPVAQPGVCVDGRGTCRAVARGPRPPPPRTRVDRGVHGATRGPRVPHAFAVSSVSVCRAFHAGKNAPTPVRGLSLLAAPSSALATPWPSRVALPRASTSPASHTPSPHSSRSDLFRTGETGQRPSGTTLRFLLRGNPRSLPEPRSPGEDAPSSVADFPQGPEACRAHSRRFAFVPRHQRMNRGPRRPALCPFSVSPDAAPACLLPAVTPLLAATRLGSCRLFFFFSFCRSWKALLPVVPQLGLGVSDSAVNVTCSQRGPLWRPVWLSLYHCVITLFKRFRF